MMVLVKAGFNYNELMEMPGETFASFVNIYSEAMTPPEGTSKVTTYKVMRKVKKTPFPLPERKKQES